MEFHLIIFLLLCAVICGEACVTYNFEDGLDSFDPTLGTVCSSVNNNWVLKQYESSLPTPPHPLSETFITPATPSSCVSSFIFDVENGGEVEVAVYMRSTEFMTITIHNEAGQQVATWGSFTNPIPTNQWTTIVLTVETVSADPIRAYLTLFATVTSEDTILIDSFRYIPPNQDADDIECAIYSDNGEPATTENDSTTESLTTENDSTTESITTENDSTTETITTENDSTTETITTENYSTTETITTENYSTTETITTENDGTTESLTTENDSTTESLTTDNDGTTESLTTEHDDTTVTSNTDNDTEASTTEQEYSTTDSYTTDTDSTEPDSGEAVISPDEEDPSSFWTPLTIGLVAAGSFLVLLSIIYISYWCGKRKEKNKIPEILYLDIEEIPKTIVVPRVKRVYTDSMHSSNPYAKDYL